MTRLAAAAIALVGAVGPTHAAAPTPLRAARGAVASDHPAASAAGAEALRRGGNAVDAACATAMALGVVNPHASGLGGGGFALVYLAKERKVVALDFRERAPGAIRPELFFRDGKPDPKLSQRGGLAVAVPGEARGLADLVKRWGKRPFADCVKPAERLARGFAATDRLVLSVSEMKKRSPEGPTFLERVFTYKEPLAAGTIVRRPALAGTLARLRQGGADAFYKGPIAEAIVRATREAGGVMTLEDLRDYAPSDRTPLAIDYRGRKVFSMPPPSSGGIVIAEALGVLAARAPDLKALGHNSSGYLHLLAEALKHGFADRARHLGDTDFVEVPTAKLLDPAYHKELAGRVGDAVRAPHEYGFGGTVPAPPKDGGTAHLSVIDAEGNAVALTTTINLWFGAQIVAGQTGIVLNNEMDDFSLAPEVANAFGLVGTDKNAIAPRKRPLSSMSPTIVLEGDRVKLAVGGAGGPTIISGTLQVLLNVLDFGMDAQEASAAPRIHHQWRPDALVHEPEHPRDVTAALEKRGHKLRPRPQLTLVNVVVRTDQGLEAAAEYRGSGAPAGY